jgi:phthalate 4,5-cis-dihydrodiol dehydrogenase
MIAEGAIGRVRMIHALYATDFLYRPRRGDELSTDQGGGAIFSQAIHQIDLVRRLAGKPATRVTARTGGAWDPSRPTEGAYSALIDFEDDVFASLTYSGYAHFDGDRLMDNISELGCSKPDTHVSARESLKHISDENAAKRQRGFTRLEDCPDPVTHEHFGQVLVFGEHGDLRLTPRGVELSDDSARGFHAAPFTTSRAEVFDALYSAIRGGETPLQDGRYGRASLEICHALLESEARRESVALPYPTGVQK